MISAHYSAIIAAYIGDHAPVQVSMIRKTAKPGRALCYQHMICCISTAYSRTNCANLLLLDFAIGCLDGDMSSYLEAVAVFDAQHQAWSMLKLNGEKYLLSK